jgi:hypothetical protein
LEIQRMSLRKDCKNCLEFRASKKVRNCFHLAKKSKNFIEQKLKERLQKALF